MACLNYVKQCPPGDRISFVCVLVSYSGTWINKKKAPFLNGKLFAYQGFLCFAAYSYTWNRFHHISHVCLIRPKSRTSCVTNVSSLLITAQDWLDGLNIVPLRSRSANRQTQTYTKKDWRCDLQRLRLKVKKLFCIWQMRTF